MFGTLGSGIPMVLAAGVREPDGTMFGTVGSGIAIFPVLGVLPLALAAGGTILGTVGVGIVIVFTLGVFPPAEGTMFGIEGVGMDSGVSLADPKLGVRAEALVTLSPGRGTPG